MDTTRLRWWMITFILASFLWRSPQPMAAPVAAPAPEPARPVTADVRPVADSDEVLPPPAPESGRTLYVAERERRLHLQEERRVAVLDKFRQAFATQGYPKQLGDRAVELAQGIGADPLLLYALIKVESDFDCGLVYRDPNGTRDHGCMQLNDSSWPAMARNLGIAEADPLNPEQNLRMGVWWLGYMHRRFGTWEAALTAYNTGEYGLARIQRETGGSSSTYSRAVLGRLQRLRDQVPG